MRAGWLTCSSALVAAAAQAALAGVIRIAFDLDHIAVLNVGEDAAVSMAEIAERLDASSTPSWWISTSVDTVSGAMRPLRPCDVLEISVISPSPLLLSSNSAVLMMSLFGGACPMRDVLAFRERTQAVYIKEDLPRHRTRSCKLLRQISRMVLIRQASFSPDPLVGASSPFGDVPRAAALAQRPLQVASLPPSIRARRGLACGFAAHPPAPLAHDRSNRVHPGARRRPKPDAHQ